MMIRVILFILVSTWGNSYAGNFENFVKKDLPVKYPKILSYLNENKIITVNWVSQTGDNQSEKLELDSQRAVVIRTKMFMGAKNNMNTPVTVLMKDRNLDSKVDFIEYKIEGRPPKSIDSPTDEGSMYLWYMALAIAVKYSDCCN